LAGGEERREGRGVLARVPPVVHGSDEEEGTLFSLSSKKIHYDHLIFAT
jgi:hypothetical protein